MEDNTTANSVVCLLTLHFKAIELHDKNSDLREVTNQLKLKVSIGDDITHIEMKNCSHKIVLDKFQYFHIQVPHDPEDWDGNILLVQLIIESRLVPDHYTVLGEAHIHIHQIANDSPFTAQTTLSNKNEAVASIILDCALNYGIFGFGESVQVHCSHRDREDKLRWSTFPRLTNHSKEQSDTHKSNYFIDKVCCFLPIQAKAITETKEISLVDKMKRLPEWKLQCSIIRDRSKKLEFLEKVMTNQLTLSRLPPEPGITSRPT